MGKSSPSVPAAPDPTATAAAQSTADVNTAAAQTALNDTNQYTPYGATTYAPTGSYTTPSGQTVPTYTQSTQLNPLAQSILTGQQTLANNQIPIAQQLQGQAAASTAVPLNTNTPFSSTLNQGPQLLNQNVTNAIYGQQKGFLDPQWNQQQTLLQDQLSRQGIGVGNDAYSNAMQQFNNAKTQAYQSAQDSAIAGGTGAASNLFNMALQGQGQNLSQQQLLQSNPLQLEQAALGAAPQTPSQPITSPAQSTVAPTDVIGAQGLSTQAQMAAYQAQLAQNNATFGGLASLGGAGILALGISDRRGKIVGSKFIRGLEMIDALPVSNARYLGEEIASDRPMIMADDLERILPTAVVGTSTGDLLQQIKPAELIPVLIAAVRELSEKVRRLETAS